REHDVRVGDAALPARDQSADRALLDAHADGALVDVLGRDGDHVGRPHRTISHATAPPTAMSSSPTVGSGTNSSRGRGVARGTGLQMAGSARTLSARAAIHAGVRSVTSAGRIPAGPGAPHRNSGTITTESSATSASSVAVSGSGGMSTWA